MYLCISKNIQEMDKKYILVIVDFQKDFYDRKGGTLAVPNAEHALEGIKQLISGDIQHIDSIIFTQDWHLNDHCSFKENGGIWPKHCVANTPGGRVHPELSVNPDNFQNGITWYLKGMNSNKEEYAAFLDLQKTMNTTLLDNNYAVVVCGLAGDYCVVETAKVIQERYYKKTYLYTPGIASISETDFQNKAKQYNLKLIDKSPINSLKTKIKHFFHALCR